MLKDKSRANRLIAVAVAFYLLLEIAAFSVAIGRALNQPNATSAFYFWFYLGRLALLATVIVLFFVRQRRRFYIATLSELSSEDYWSLVFVGFAGIKLLFARFFIQLSSNLVVEYSLLTFLIINLLIRYQSQYWVFDKKKSREKRIYRLVRKAQLSRTEYEAALPFLTDNGRKNQRSPWIWKVTICFAIVITGAILNAVAVQLIDSFGPILKP